MPILYYIIYISCRLYSIGSAFAMLCFTPATAKALGRYVFQKIFLAHQEREKLSVSPITVTSRIPAAYMPAAYISALYQTTLSTFLQ